MCRTQRVVARRCCCCRRRCYRLLMGSSFNMRTVTFNVVLWTALVLPKSIEGPENVTSRGAKMNPETS